jgi:glucan 1,3-beta-glucosidase
MHSLHYLLFLSTLLSYAGTALGLGSACNAPLGAGQAAPTDPFWMQNIKHQGISAYHPDPSAYQVFRNVKVWKQRFPGFIT